MYLVGACEGFLNYEKPMQRPYVRQELPYFVPARNLALYKHEPSTGGISMIMARTRCLALNLVARERSAGQTYISDIERKIGLSD